MTYKFTESAEKAIQYANEITLKLGHNYIGSEHILYGLVKEKTGISNKVLEEQGIVADKVENEIKKIMGETLVKTKKILGFTPRTKRILENASAEAKKVASNYIGTEHILVGIMREEDSIAIRILINLSVDLKKIYDNVLEEGIELLYKIFSNIENIRNCSFIIIDNYTSYKKITNELWYKNRNNITGLWYEEDIETQNIFDTSKLSRTDLTEDFPGLAYYFHNDSYQVIKSVGITGEEYDWYKK